MAGDEKTITARFVADTSGFTTGAEEVEASSKAIEESTASMGQQFEYTWTSLDRNGKVVQQTMTTTSEAVAENAKAINDQREQALGLTSAMSDVNDASKEVAKSTDEVAGNIAAVGDISDKTTKSTEDVAANIAGVGDTSKEASKGIDAVGGASEEAAKSTETLTESTKKTKTATDDAKESQVGFMRGLQEMQNIIQIVQLIGQMVTAMDKMNEAMKNSQIAFSYLMNSADAANQTLKELNSSFAAQAFGTQVIDNAAQHMLMLGKNAQETEQVISKAADGLAAMGKDGSQLDAVVTQLEKMKSETRITTQEIDQLVQQGLPAWDALAQGMGTDIKTAQREVQAGAVSGSQAFNDMMSGLDKYTGAAQEKSDTLGATWNKLGQDASQAFGPIIETLKKVLESIDAIIQAVSHLNDSLRSLGGGFGGQFMDTMGSLLSHGGIGPLGPLGSFAGFASGGTNLPSGWRVVGEDGPELQWSPGGDTIVPNGSDPMTFLGLGSGGSGSITLAGMSGGGASGPLVVELYFDTSMFAQAVIPQIAPVMRQYFGVRR